MQMLQYLSRFNFNKHETFLQAINTILKFNLISTHTSVLIENVMQTDIVRTVSQSDLADHCYQMSASHSYLWLAMTRSFKFELPISKLYALFSLYCLYVRDDQSVIYELLFIYPSTHEYRPFFSLECSIDYIIFYVSIQMQRKNLHLVLHLEDRNMWILKFSHRFQWS